MTTMMEMKGFDIRWVGMALGVSRQVGDLFGFI